VYSLNLILTTETDLFALRYPETHELYLLDRHVPNDRDRKPLRQHSALGTTVHADDAQGDTGGAGQRADRRRSTLAAAPKR